MWGEVCEVCEVWVCKVCRVSGVWGTAEHQMSTELHDYISNIRFKSVSITYSIDVT